MEQQPDNSPARPAYALFGLSILAIALLQIGFAVCSQAAVAQVVAPQPEAAPAIDMESLSAAERKDLLSRLSDEQVRDLMLTYMVESAAAEETAAPAMDRLHEGITQFRQALGEHWSHIGDLRSAPGYIYDRLAEGRSPYHPLVVLAVFAVIALLAWGGEKAYRHSIRRFYTNLDPQEEIDPLRRLGQAATRFLLNLIGVAIFAAGVIVLFLLLHEGHTATRLTVTTLLMALLVVRLVAAVSDFFFSADSHFLRIAPFNDQDALLIHRWIVIVAALTAFGILLCGLMLQLGLPESQHLLLLDVVGIVIVAALIAGAFRARKAVADSLVSQVKGAGAGSRALVGMLSSWHLLFTAYVIILYSMSLYTSVTGGGAASYPGLMSLLVLVLFPAVDFALRTVMDRFLPHSDDNSGARKQDSLPVFKRAARILLIIFAVFLVGRIWGVDFFTLGKQGIGEELVRAIVDIALTLLAAYVGWGVIKAALASYLPDEDAEAAGGDEGGASSAGRLETIMPLVLRFVQITLAVIVAMIILSSLGVDIAPLWPAPVWWELPWASGPRAWCAMSYPGFSS